MSEPETMTRRRFVRATGATLASATVLAMRSGDWKLHLKQKEDFVELYNVVQDPAQTRNLALEVRDRASQMKAELLNWRRTLPWR